MKKSYLIACAITMLLSVILFVFGFTGAVAHRTSGIRIFDIVLIALAILLIAVSSVLTVLSAVKGNFFPGESSAEKEDGTTPESAPRV